MNPLGKLTPHQVAALFHVSPNSVYAALQAGRLPGLKTGHQWFIERRALIPHGVASLQQSERPQASRRVRTPPQPHTHHGRRE